ncbi:MAG: hypothetical protein LAT81_01290 [Oceanicaulis sp.]|nr:hypothetical protein [Oceanicaulis sp.]
MVEAGIDDMEAGPGEAGFLMQLRPPPAADPAALADQIDRFTARFLAQREPDGGRYARLGPLTWALAAPESACETVHETARALGVLLFGTDDDTVWLIERGPEAVEDEDSDDVWDIDAGPSPDPGPGPGPCLDLEAPAFDLDSLTEPPVRAGAPDITGELAAFRIEMRAIARTIPDAADREREALGAFREELQQLTSAAGDRFDAAAGRIETATAALPDAAARVEASATLMETSVREALEALTRACAAMAASRDGATRAG